MIAEEQLTDVEIREMWPVLSGDERAEAFALLDREMAQDFFLTISPGARASLITRMPKGERKLWLRLLAPDDTADVIQQLSPENRHEYLELLDDIARKEVNALLLYKEDVAGGLMSPRFARVRPDLTVDEAIRYLRLQAQEQLENLYYIYVVDEEQKLLGVASFRDLFKAQPLKKVNDVMIRDVVTVREDQDQESVARLFAQRRYLAVPVVDSKHRLKGIITADDILHAVQNEATEDIQKLGGMEALNRPYLQMNFIEMVKRRAGWLAILFLGEMLTASAMAYFEKEIARAVVLALFLPLIISSGGNSGSQATTLVIRAMALGEVRLRDWWRIMKREVLTGFVLGGLLALIGFLRIWAWQVFFQLYGPHYLLIASSVGVSLLGVVMLGTLSGSMLPFILRRLGFDPASASAPFVATLVDVSGVIIYFSVSAVLLRGTLL